MGSNAWVKENWQIKKYETVACDRTGWSSDNATGPNLGDARFEYGPDTPGMLNEVFMIVLIPSRPRYKLD
jgi:hypothetical protein